MKVRSLVRTIHFALAAVLGGLVVLSGVTGSVLVFKEEIDAALNPALLRVEPAGHTVGLERMLAVAEAAVPGAAARRVRLPRSPDESAEVWVGTDGGGERAVYVDPYRGHVLGHRAATESAMGWLFGLHKDLLAGEVGSYVSGAGGIGLLLLALSGLWLWWPGRRKIRLALTVKRGASGYRRHYDLHRAGGFYALPLLVLLAVTGLSLVFYVAFQTGLNRVTGSPDRPPFPAVESPGRGSPQVDAALAAAEAVLPALTATWVLLPATPETPLLVRGRLPGELHPTGKSYVALDPYRGAVLEVRRGTEARLGWTLYDVLYPLHIGHWGGLFSRLLYAAAGLVPLFLGVTGLIVWRCRTRKPARRAAGRLSSQPQRIP